MIKVGDRVTLFSDIRKNGTVIEIYLKKDAIWYVGGTAGKKTVAKVKFDDEEIREFPVGELMRLE